MVGPNPITSILIKRGNLETDTHSLRKDYVQTQGVDGHLHTKGRGLHQTYLSLLSEGTNPADSCHRLLASRALG